MDVILYKMFYFVILLTPFTRFLHYFCCISAAPFTLIQINSFDIRWPIQSDVEENCIFIIRWMPISLIIMIYSSLLFIQIRLYISQRCWYNRQNQFQAIPFLISQNSIFASSIKLHFRQAGIKWVLIEIFSGVASGYGAFSTKFWLFPGGSIQWNITKNF